MQDLGGMPARYSSALDIIAIANGTSFNDEIVAALRTVRYDELRNFGPISVGEQSYGTAEERNRMRRVQMDVPPELTQLALKHSMIGHDIMLRAIERHIQRVMVDDAVGFAGKLVKAGLVETGDLASVS